MQEKLVGALSDRPWLRASLASTYTQIASHYGGRGDTVEALAVMDRARKPLDELASSNPKVTDFRNSLAVLHNNIGTVHARVGQPAKALESFRQSAAIQRKLVEDHPD